MEKVIKRKMFRVASSKNDQIIIVIVIKPGEFCIENTRHIAEREGQVQMLLVVMFIRLPLVMITRLCKGVSAGSQHLILLLGAE